MIVRNSIESRCAPCKARSKHPGSISSVIEPVYQVSSSRARPGYRLPLPRYSQRFSRHTYTQQQLLILLLLKEYLHAIYRNAIDLISLKGKVCRLLNLRTFPHITPLQMFLTRISSGFLSQVIHHLAQATLPLDAVVSRVAVDARGSAAIMPVISTVKEPDEREKPSWNSRWPWTPNGWFCLARR